MVWITLFPRPTTSNHFHSFIPSLIHSVFWLVEEIEKEEMGESKKEFIMKFLYFFTFFFLSAIL